MRNKLMCLMLCTAVGVTSVFGSGLTVVNAASSPENAGAESEEYIDDELFYDDEDSDEDCLIEEDDEEDETEEVDSEEVDDEDEDELDEEVTEEELEEAVEVLDPKDISVKYEITSRWKGHFNADITLENISESKIENWEIEFPTNVKIENIWNARIQDQDEDGYIIKNVDWNQDIDVKKQVRFGFTCSYDESEEIEIPEECDNIKEYAEVGGDYDVSLTVFNKWDNKVNGQISIKNNTGTKLEDW
ncbi:MAG: cellulose binding domain-containing protein [Eubacterium sp.]|nr:cellulose binding domain-containing protein [Eubacterium sp.]